MPTSPATGRRISHHLVAGPDYPGAAASADLRERALIKNQEWNFTNQEDLGCAAGQQSPLAGVAAR